MGCGASNNNQSLAGAAGTSVAGSSCPSHAYTGSALGANHRWQSGVSRNNQKAGGNESSRSNRPTEEYDDGDEDDDDDACDGGEDILECEDLEDADEIGLQFTCVMPSGGDVRRIRHQSQHHHHHSQRQSSSPRSPVLHPPLAVGNASSGIDSYYFSTQEFSRAERQAALTTTANNLREEGQEFAELTGFLHRHPHQSGTSSGDKKSSAGTRTTQSGATTAGVTVSSFQTSTLDSLTFTKDREASAMEMRRSKQSSIQSWMRDTTFDSPTFTGGGAAGASLVAPRSALATSHFRESPPKLQC